MTGKIELEALELDARPGMGDVVHARFLPQAVAVVLEVKAARLCGPYAVVSECHVHERKAAAAFVQLVPDRADILCRRGKAADGFSRTAGIRHDVAPDAALPRLGPGEQREQGGGSLAGG